MFERKLSRTLGQIRKGFAYDSSLGGFPLVQVIVAPEASGNTSVLASTAITTSAQKITTGITSPDVPRAISIKGNQAGCDSVVRVYGKNSAGRNIYEDITASGASVVQGNLVFAKVDYVLFPAKAIPAGDEISVGTTTKLGLQRPINASADLVLLEVDGTAEAASAVSATYNTFTPTTVPNGVRVYKVYFNASLV